MSPKRAPSTTKGSPHGFAASKEMEKMTTNAMNRRKGRLRLILILAAALGCSSAALSGVLAVEKPISLG